MMWGYGYNSGFMPWGMLTGSLMMVLVTVGVILLIRYLFRSGQWQDGHQTSAFQAPQDAMSILKERYAKGEITREEYVGMREDINNDKG